MEVRREGGGREGGGGGGGRHSWVAVEHGMAAMVVTPDSLPWEGGV